MYDVNGVISDIKAGMLDPKGKFKKVLVIYMIFTFCLVSFFGMICSFAFGENTEEVIFFNLSLSKGFKTLMLVIDFTYPISLIPGLLMFNYPNH